MRQSIVLAKSRQTRPPKNCVAARAGSLDMAQAILSNGQAHENNNLSHIPFTAIAFRRGFVAALPFIASNGSAGVVMGVAYRGLGLGFRAAMLFSLVVYSATAQAVTLGLWALPPPIAAMVAACGATNARYLVMGAHLRQLFPDV